MKYTIPLSLTAALFIGAPPGARAADSGTDASGDQLETVIVTAQKRSEDVQSVPISIGVIDSHALEALHATQLADYANYLPGTQLISTGTPGQGQMSLRGIPPLGSSGTVAYYIDDTPLSSSSLYGASASTTLDLLPYDFQDFEVLRGPQGTLWGASALGGLVTYTSRLPSLDTFQADVGADTFHIDGGDKLGYGGRLRLSVPLIPGELAVSGSFSRENTPGYVDNAATGAQNQNPYSQQAARIMVLFKPGDDLLVKVSALQQRIDASSANYVALEQGTLQPLYGRLRDDNRFPEIFDSTINFFSVSLDWNLHFADFTSSTGYSQTQSHSVVDASLTYGVIWGGLAPFTEDFDLDKVTQEFRLRSKPADHLEWLAGAFYTNERSRQSQLLNALTTDLAPVPGLNPAAIVGLPSSYREYALYGQATYKIVPAFDVVGGVRFAKNLQAFEQISSGAIFGATTVQPGHSSQGVWTYSVSPEWHITPDDMLYFRVASGYQAGGPNLALPQVPSSVGADTVTNYELGLKSEYWDHRVQLDVDAFYIDWHKIQVSATTAGGVNYIVNGGTARSEGLEFSSKLRPVERLELGLNATWSEALITEDIASIGGLKDDNLPYVPRWAASATADYLIPIRGEWGARLGGGLRYNGRTVTTVTHSPEAEPLASYTTLDLNAAVEDPRWAVRLFVRNAANRVVYTNEVPIVSAATGGIGEVRGVPLQPRTVGLAVDFKY